MVVITIGTLACVTILFYMWLQARENNVRMHEVMARGVGEPVHLFFISDTHARVINKKMIESISEKVDAVIIGGDFVDRHTSEQTLHQNIETLKTLGPNYFVWGNNDVEYDEKKLRKLFSDNNITLLENEAVVLGNTPLFLSAVTYRPGEENIARALATCDLDKTVFISHNPELFYKVYRRFKPLLSIGGHLHGGQIRIGKWGIQPHGYFKQRGYRYELVSNGYGTSLLPLRLGAKPECHIIKIIFEQNKTFTE